MRQQLRDKRALQRAIIALHPVEIRLTSVGLRVKIGERCTISQPSNKSMIEVRHFRQVRRLTSKKLMDKPFFMDGNRKEKADQQFAHIDHLTRVEVEHFLVATLKTISQFVERTIVTVLQQMHIVPIQQTVNQANG